MGEALRKGLVDTASPSGSVSLSATNPAECSSALLTKGGSTGAPASSFCRSPGAAKGEGAGGSSTSCSYCASSWRVRSIRSASAKSDSAARVSFTPSSSVGSSWLVAVARAGVSDVLLDTTETFATSSDGASTVMEENETTLPGRDAFRSGALRSVKRDGTFAGAIPSAEETDPVVEAGTVRPDMIGEERGEWVGVGKSEADKSRSVVLARPSLAILPVSTRMDETETAPGVRGIGGSASRYAAAVLVAGEPSGEATGVASPPPPSFAEGTLMFSRVTAPFRELAALLERLSAGEPVGGVDERFGEVFALTLRGVTTPSGTGALPAPRLTTRWRSSPCRSRLPLPPTPPVDERGFAGASPNEPPSGSNGRSSAWAWKREILSDTRVTAPVRTESGDLDGGAVEEAEVGEVEGEPRPSRAMRSDSLPVCAILSGVDLSISQSNRAVSRVRGEDDDAVEAVALRSSGSHSAERLVRERVGLRSYV